ncbi:MAG: FAD-binding oxidoreductase [Chitinophagaceae bacterium]|nr:FAD-binding oxidoreductase [Chitinophagaceae bacterium]MCW5927030.1 FAD-binding oxidoreductase [Chitinophagaceae bacterium]
MSQELTAALKKSLKGKLVLPADAEYDAARKVFNGMIDKYPAAIAQVANVQDVIATVNFARENNLLLAVRCGGHSVPGFGTCDGGLVIDLSLLKAIEVNAEAKTVRVGGGCLLKEVDAVTHEIGMAVPFGFYGGTGVGGLTLGGGLGYLTRKYGLSIDNLLEADVVLADGSVVKASASENPDLFWALRGGGGNFGVVVSFLFRLHPVHTVYGGLMLWDWEDSKEIMKWYNGLMTTGSNALNGFFVLMIVPPGDPFPQHLHNKKVCGIVWCYSGDMNLAEEVFAPIRAFKKTVLDFTGPMSFPVIQTMFDQMYTPGMYHYWKPLFVKNLDDVSIDTYIKQGQAMPTLMSSMHIYPVNGAAAQIAKDATAWSYRDAKYVVIILGIDTDPGKTKPISEWTREYWNALLPYGSGGAYVNFESDEGFDTVKTTYGGSYERLSQIKAKYDPGNLFRVNQNIKPA